MISCAATLYVIGLDVPLAVCASAAGVGIIATISMLLSSRPELLRTPRSLAAHGVHLGFALMVLGVSFSGPYKNENDITILPGQTYAIGDYTFTLQTVKGGDSSSFGQKPGSPPAYIYQEAHIAVSRSGAQGLEDIGILKPQLRIYAQNPGMPSTEVSTLFSLGSELYATFLGISGNTAVLRISINPLINWIWIGGIILCLFPFLGIRSAKRKQDKVLPCPEQNSLEQNGDKNRQQAAPSENTGKAPSASGKNRRRPGKHHA